jgi:hypothetical protein
MEMDAAESSVFKKCTEANYITIPSTGNIQHLFSGFKKQKLMKKDYLQGKCMQVNS